MPGRTDLRALLSSDSGFRILVASSYSLAVVLAMATRGFFADRMMLVAERVLSGHLDAPALRGTIDTAESAGHYYIAVGPLQLLAYIPFAAVAPLQTVGGYAAGLAIGISGAMLALPLVRAYGASGPRALWLAVFAALGTLLFWSSVFGNFYYLAHAESFLALTVFLIEWQGQRRALILGACLGFSFLARPTTVLAAVPFGLYLLWRSRDRPTVLARRAMLFGLPIAAAIAVFGWFNWVRFGSMLETGYGISYLPIPDLLGRRSLGLFSIVQVPENLRLALLAPPTVVAGPPFLVASPWGMSMALVSPALILSIRAGLRGFPRILLWAAVALVAAPVFLFYGGGIVQYGFRYSLDFTPFLVALMALGSSPSSRIGGVAKLLIAASVASVVIGILWYCGT